MTKHVYSLRLFIKSKDNKKLFRQVMSIPLIIKQYDYCVKVCTSCIESIDEIINNVDYSLPEDYYNSAFFVKVYVRMWNGISSYWHFFKLKEYNTSWMYLQDAIDYLDILIKYLDESETNILKILCENLLVIEKTFPYYKFLSEGYIIKKQKCSICGNEPFDEKCGHINGNLYYGKIAKYIIEDCELVELSLTDKPNNKRNVLITDGIDYSILDELNELVVSPLLLIIANKIEYHYNFEVQRKSIDAHAFRNLFDDH